MTQIISNRSRAFGIVAATRRDIASVGNVSVGTSGLTPVQRVAVRKGDLRHPIACQLLGGSAELLQVGPIRRCCRVGPGSFTPSLSQNRT
jgi:hypothetical protein